MLAASRAPPCARHITPTLTETRPGQRFRAGRRPLLLAGAAGTPTGGAGGSERGGGTSKQSHAPALVSEPNVYASRFGVIQLVGGVLCVSR